MQHRLRGELSEKIRQMSQHSFDAVIVLRDLSWCGLDGLHDVQFFSSSTRVFRNDIEGEGALYSIPLFNPVSDQIVYALEERILNPV